jgi:hypothetical protein
VATLTVLAALAACVPTGSAPPYDAGTPPTTAASFRPSLNVMTAPFEDNFDRPDSGEGMWGAFEAGAAAQRDSGNASANASASTSPATSASGIVTSAEAGPMAHGDAGMLSFFGKEAGAGPEIPPTDRANLGPNWVQIRSSAWRVEGGKLCVQNAHNHPVWLNRTLPVNARIEFDATGYTDDGDLKAEVWGDGTSYATGTSYTNATSYLTVLGGWKNTIHTLARLNEHGTDRKEIHVDKDSDDPRQRPAQKGQTYHFKIERTDGKTVRWSVDGVDMVSFADPAPLAGQGHDHFGFNEWEAKVCFDNVKVTPL